MGLSEKHLSASERAEIARSLFEVKSEDPHNGELHGLCPIHDEKNPSFSYNYEKDKYHCFSCTAGGDLIKLWAHVKGYGEGKEGFKAFCEQYGIPLDTASPNSPPAPPFKSELDKAWERMKPLPDDWCQRLLETRGWTRDTIDRMDLRQQTCLKLKKSAELKKISRPDRVAIPIRDAAGKLINIRLYKPGGKVNKIISWGTGFGKSRLFPAKPAPSEPVLLCEGEQDTLCALSNDFNAITQTSKTKYWKDNHLAPFKGRDVIIAYDADAAGQKYAEYAADCIDTIAKSVRLLQWPNFMGRQDDGQWPADHGQDLTDFFVTHKKSAGDLQDLINEAAAYVPPVELDRLSTPTLFFEQGVNGRYSFKPRLLANKVLEDIQMMYEPSTGLLYKWNDRFWEVFEEDQVKNMCVRYLGFEAQRSRAEDATFQAKILSTIPHGRQVNDLPNWVCTQSCMVNLKSLNTRPHNMEDYCTYELGVKYDPDSGQKCKRWLKFLEETVQTESPIKQLQEFAGLCMTREVRYGKCLFLFGPGSDGKSVFIKTLRKLVGPDNCSAVSFQDLEDQFHRSSIYNKLLNISTEVGSKALESMYFKAITTGDPINAAFKHRTPFEFLPYCKLVFAANKMPRVLDNSDGFFRRVLPVYFKRQFFDDKDSYLEDKLEDELSEIFQWALVGLHRLWEQDGFTDCDETQSLLIDYRRLNNPVLCFVEDKCTIDEKFSVSKTDLYKEYKNYVSENGYSLMNRENFFRELYAAINNLKEHRPRISGKRERQIKGIGLEITFDED